jgi:hypothetical protein
MLQEILEDIVLFAREEAPEMMDWYLQTKKNIVQVYRQHGSPGRDKSLLEEDQAVDWFDGHFTLWKQKQAAALPESQALIEEAIARVVQTGEVIALGGGEYLVTPIATLRTLVEYLGAILERADIAERPLDEAEVQAVEYVLILSLVTFKGFHKRLGDIEQVEP